MSPEKTGQVRIVKWSPNRPSDAVSAFLNRPAFAPEAEAVARETLAGIREKGDEAVMSIRNFGEKSLDELRQKMREKGYLKDGIDKESE